MFERGFEGGLGVCVCRSSSNTRTWPCHRGDGDGVYIGELRGGGGMLCVVVVS